MAAVNKDQLLDKLEAQVNAHLGEAVSVYQNMNSVWLLQAAPDGGWSIAQNLEHLNRYGAYYLPQIQKGLGRQQHFSGNEAFKSTWLGNYFTRIMDPQTGRKKYKAFKGYIPGADLDAHGVVAEFIRQQENLLICLQRARRADLNSVRIPVSILKWLRLKLGDVFRFIIAHDERHLVQAGKVAAAVTGR